MLAAYNEAGSVIDAGSLNFVRRGDNGWEPCSRKDAQALSVQTENYAGLYALKDGVVLEEQRRAFVFDVPETSLTMQTLGTTDEHTVQISDLESGAMDLADVLGVSASEAETALVDLADTIEALSERIEALEAKGE